MILDDIIKKTKEDLNRAGSQVQYGVARTLARF